MFKIIPNPTFTATVALSAPGSDRAGEITFTFRHKTARELAAWNGRAATADGDAAFLDEVIEAWAGVVGEGDAPVPYSRGALAQLLDNFPAAGSEIYLAYSRQLRDARAKN